MDFGTITYGLADVDKTYVYTVTESATMAGVTNDAAIHTVTVKVTDPNKDGKLKVERTYSSTGSGDAQTFTNTYKIRTRLTALMELRHWKAARSARMTNGPLP